MSVLRDKLLVSPVHARVAPYFIIVLLTFVQDGFGGPARYWFYFAKMVVAAWCVWEMRGLVPEMKWAFSWEAVAAGVAVFVIWVGLDPYYPRFSLLFKASDPWNPFKQFGDASVLGWFFVSMRITATALVVPQIEETFYRSFLYRYFVRVNFTEMPLNRVHGLSLVVTSLFFGLVHYEWLAGILCGLTYQWLVLRKNRLGDAMTAHAITNFLLGVWIVWRGAWNFW